jgi:hypothetical protein
MHLALRRSSRLLLVLCVTAVAALLSFAAPAAAAVRVEPVPGTPGDRIVRDDSCAGSFSFRFGNQTGQFQCDSRVYIFKHQDGRDEAFGIGTNGRVYHSWQTTPGATSTTPWTLLGSGILIRGINLDNRIPTISGQGQNGSKYCTRISNGAWTAWYRC